MPLDIKRTAMIAGAAAAIDYVAGGQLAALVPSSLQGSDANMQSAVRTLACVAAADILMQNM